jgi:hypothetical protein
VLYECIYPEIRDGIREMMEGSIEEIARFELGGPGDIWDARIHWNCCPACRNEFPSLPAVLEQAGRNMEQVFAASLCLMKDNFLAQKTSLATMGSDGSAYPAIIAALACAEELVHSELHHALGTSTTLYRGTALQFDTWSQPLLSYCRDFISSLEPDVQHFVFASTISFELVRPMWERVGLPPREDPRTPEEIRADLNTKIARQRTGEGAEPTQELVLSLEERLQRAIVGSGLEAKVLWETIDAAASAHVGGLEAAGHEPLLQTWITKFEENFDNFADSMKATQMEAVRLSERSIRKAADYRSEVTARVGPWLYSRLHKETQQQLNAAEYLYELNRQEPRYCHGPVISLALGYENELMLQLGWPIVKKLADSGVETYPAGEKHGQKQGRPLIAKGQIQEKNMALGSIAWYLRFHADFRNRALALGFDPDAISKDAFEVIKGRDKAAHQLVCELAAADKLRSLILCSDSILGHLHPGTANNSKI